MRSLQWWAIRGPLREPIRDDSASNRFGGMRREPVNNNTASSELTQNIPQRFRSARIAAHRSNVLSIRRRFDERENAMLVAALTGGDRRPQDRGKESVSVAIRPLVPPSMGRCKFGILPLSRSGVRNVQSAASHPMSKTVWLAIRHEKTSPA